MYTLFRLRTKPFKVDTDTLWCMCMRCVDLDIYLYALAMERLDMCNTLWIERLVCCPKKIYMVADAPTVEVKYISYSCRKHFKC